MSTYLLIGAGPGIGLATAQRFARAGLRIVLASRSAADRPASAAAVAALRAGGAAVLTETVDAADPAAVAALVHRHADDLAVLHYNAGVLHHSPQGELLPRRLAQESLASLSGDMHINLVSALAAVQAAEAAMAPRRSGTVLLTGGGFGVEPTPDFLNISVAKAGLRAAARALFGPLQAQGIHLATATVSTLVAPGSAKAAEIAEVFWGLHAQAPGAWDWEAVVQ